MLITLYVLLEHHRSRHEMGVSHLTYLRCLISTPLCVKCDKLIQIMNKLNDLFHFIH